MRKHLFTQWGLFPLLFASLLFATACTDPNDDSESSKSKDGKIKGHEYVDLALPSGLLWATCNVGAEVPEAYGDYFAWGETEPKSDYGMWSNYKYCNDTEGNSFSKYVTNNEYGNVDNKTTLDSSDDAATANWGSKWRMPTQEEWQELTDGSNCKWTWTTHGVFEGYQVTSVRNGKSIFLPAAGYRYDSRLSNAGSDGYYWSSSLYESRPYSAWYCSFNSSSHDADYANGRYYGKSVRPVAEP